MTRRRWLWLLAVGLVAVLLALLIWLVGRYEQSRFEEQQERSAADMTLELRSQLARNAQRLQVLTQWQSSARQMLELHPEILRIEQRDIALGLGRAEHSPYVARQAYLPDIQQTCALALRLGSATYGSSYFVPQGDGTGFEVSDMCLAQTEGGKLVGYVVATYSLQGMLKEWLKPSLAREQEITLTEADGTRLAAIGSSARSGDKVSAHSVFDLQGLTLILRVDSWHTAPYWLANTPTALVLALVLALCGVLWLLVRDTRKRRHTEAEFRQSQERLQRSARLATLGEMASMLSHELNQPLATIASYATGSLNLLNDSTQDAPHALDLFEIKTALERIAQQSQRAGLVIKSVNDFVRRREAERVAIAPKALFDAILPILALQARQLGVQLRLEVDADLPPVWCDKTLIEQVIINLARNGMQSMQTMPAQTHKQLLLSAARISEGGIEFAILDTGPGMTPEIEEKLLTPFFTTKDEGTGLGLSLCRTVVEQHGSNLTYTSGDQTRFSFQLTLATS